MFAQLLSSLPVGLAALPDVAFVLQLGALGNAVGTLVAARARRRDPAVDVTRIVVAWSSLGVVVGACAEVASLLVRFVG